MNRGVSLVEVLVSLSLGMIILTGLMFFSAGTVQAHKRTRALIAVRDSLSMAHGELLEQIRGVEPAFFNLHPVRSDLIHATDHGHGSAQFSGPCPNDGDGDCLILWDIQPIDEDPVIYRVEDGLDYPSRVALTPIDDTFPPGPSDAIGRGGVLLLHNGTDSFCVLVASIENRDAVLIPVQYQPWEIPTELGSAPYEAVALGVLEVVHCSLRVDEHTGHKLNYQPWTASAEGWSASRSRSSHGHLQSLLWRPCGPGLPDRVVLIGSALDAPTLTSSIHIAGRTFDKEARCVSIEL